MPTPQQVENARNAGWTSDEAPPEGWDAHGAFVGGIVPGVHPSLDEALAAPLPPGAEVVSE